MVSFPLGWCSEEIFDIQSDYQGCPFFSMSYIRSHTFREWWMSLLDYYNKYFSCVHFKGHLMISHVSYLLLNDMDKNQQIRGSLYLNSPPLPLPHCPHPIINWGGTSIYPNYFLFFCLLCLMSFISYNF